MIDLISYALSRRPAAASEIDLSGYATKSEISDFITAESLSDLATKDEVAQVRAYKAFPSSWNTKATSSYTTKQLCDTINADANAVEGTAWLGEIRCSDISDPGVALVNGEVVVEVIKGTGTSGKVIHLILSSGNKSPYRWEYTYWNNGSNTSGWKGFYPVQANGIPKADLESSVQTTLDRVEKNKVKTGTITFTTTWDGEGPYTQLVGVDGVTISTSSKIDLQPTTEQIASLIEDGVQSLVIENDNNVLTAYALGAAPSSAMTVQCTVQETT